nr:hypothetical protein Q903MT_gene6040 [Picea sitchensis]
MFFRFPPASPHQSLPYSPQRFNPNMRLRFLPDLSLPHQSLSYLSMRLRVLTYLSLP